AYLVGPKGASRSYAFCHDKDRRGKSPLRELGKGIVQVIAPAIVESDRAGATGQRASAREPCGDFCQWKHPEGGRETLEVGTKGFRSDEHSGLYGALHRDLGREHAVV